MTAEDRAREAAQHLYAALLLSLPSDEPLLVDHVRDALALLDPALAERAAARLRGDAPAEVRS